MKKKSLKVVVDEPCHENWNDMSVNEQGRYCNSCEKTVIDFSSMSDLRLRAFLEENRGQSMCGHFRDNQLNRVILPAVADKKTYHLHAVLLGATLTTVFGLESCKSRHTVGKFAFSENSVSTDADLSISENLNVIAKSNSALKAIIEYKGTVSGMSGMQDIGLVSNATINFFSKTDKQIASVKTDENGKFKVLIGESQYPTYFCVFSDNFVMQKFELTRFPDKSNMYVTIWTEPLTVEGAFRVIEE